jgi:hypothetical protein
MPRHAATGSKPSEPLRSRSVPRVFTPRVFTPPSTPRIPHEGHLPPSNAAVLPAPNSIPSIQAQGSRIRRRSPRVYPAANSRPQPSKTIASLLSTFPKSH